MIQSLNGTKAPARTCARAFLLASAALIGLAASARAQNPADPAVGKPRVLGAQAQTQAGTTHAGAPLEEVVVTAERRSQNLQIAPIAATALNQSDLNKKAVSQISDLQFAVPSLSVTAAGLTSNVNIRGIGLESGDPNVEPGVPVYSDGLVQPPIITSNTFFDIANVEVLRGPQGTFAGASSTGGAVFITSKSPDFSGVNGNVQVKAGTYYDAGLQGAINVPLSDQVSGRIAFNSERRDSFYTNIGSRLGPNSTTYSNPGMLDEKAIRLGLLWKPTEDISVLFKTQATDKSTGGYTYRPIPGTQYAPFIPADVFTLNNDTPTKNDEKSERSSLEAKWKLGGSGITLRSVSGYGYNEVSNIEDLDATAENTPANPAGSHYQNVKERPISQEVNLISPDSGRFKWIVGGFYFHDLINIRSTTYTSFGPDAITHADVNKQAIAAFGQVSYDITPSLQIQAGGRYTRDSVNTAGFVQIGQPEVLALIDIGGAFSGSNSTGKVSLNYKLNSQNFFYVFAAKGAKAGGVSGGVPFLPETVYDYEGGWKSTLFDGRLRTQLGVFYNDYSNFQIDALAASSGQLGVINVPKSTIDGVEAQFTGNFGGLRLDFGGAYVHSSLGNITLVNSHPIGINLGPQCAVGVASNPPNCFDYAPYLLSASNTPNPYSPEFTVNVGAEYTFALNGSSTLTPRINYSYQGAQFASPLDQPADFIAARGILDLQVSYDFRRYELVGFVHNALNAVYVTGQAANNEFYGPPRELGARLLVEF